MESREIKKSQLAQYRGLGWTNEEMATKFNVSQPEIKKALQEFGMIKSRGTKDVDTYRVVLTNDVD